MKIYAVLSVVCVSVLAGCDVNKSSTADQQDRAAVDRQQQQYSIGQPIPVFDWSLERDVAIQLYQARNERVRTWTVWRSDYGMVEGHCESIGYPVPYDVQLTNPLKTEWKIAREGIAGATVEQPEPNGMYSSHNSIATWIRAVVEVEGRMQEVPIYVEGKVTCYPYPIDVDYETNRVAPANGGKPSVVIKQKG